MTFLTNLLLGLGLVMSFGALIALGYGAFRRKEWLTVWVKVLLMVLIVGGICIVSWKVHDNQGSGPSDYITWVLAVLAIGFAVLQFSDSQTQEYRMKKVAEQMSTRFVGYFPSNLKDINQVVEHARETLDIMSDYVGYGHYSDPEGFQKYYRNLQDLAARGVCIRMLVYSRDEAEKTYATQFMSPGFVQNLQKNLKRLIHYCEVFSCGLDPQFIEKLKSVKESETQNVEELRHEFSRFMFDRQLVYMKDLMERGIKIKQINDKMPFFLWCEDEHEAIFGFLNEHAVNEREVTFRTRDASLIDHTFRAKFNALWLDRSSSDITMLSKDGHREPDWFPTPVTNAAQHSLGSVA